MKKIYLILLLLVTAAVASAQHKRTDTLYVALHAAKTDTDKLLAMLKLCDHYYLAYPDSGIVLGQQAYDIAKKHNWIKPEGRCLNSLANSYATIGDYVTGMQYYFKALKLSESLNDLHSISTEYNNIGATYVQKADYKASLPYLRLSEKYLNNYGLTHKFRTVDWHLRDIILENLGEAYIFLHNIDSASYYLNICYPEAVKYHFNDVLSAIERDMGDVEAAKNNKEGALKFFRMSYICSINNDDVEDLSMSYLSTAKFYHKNNNLDSAKYYAKKAIETAAAGKYEQDVLNAAQVLYSYYDESHDLPEAYKYYKIATTAKDSLYSQDRVKQLLSLDFDEKQRQEEIAAAKIQYQDTVRMYIFIVGLVILLLLVIVFWRSGKHRQKANHLLQRQKEELQSALSQLRLTQTQLIQSEKMASLGELTAGIAHEIQNPLNFVNNFSEVSMELSEEMKEELKKGNTKEAAAIADDIEQNLAKIIHHGKRADSIVKGMLQHSRAGSTTKEITDINNLADEYLRLAYHGLRAKDKSFNAELVTHYAKDLPKANILPQDIGRVLLNLFTNAFYAVHQKQQTAGADYKPTVEISTEAIKMPSGTPGVKIMVKDNGTGIPEGVKEKIMQPFFTTKPTGQGTGLGLSLSYDIVVKGHAGEIDVETKENDYTVFTISIPV